MHARTLLVCLFLSPLAAFAVSAQSPGPVEKPAPPAATPAELLERGRLALVAQDYVAAGAALEALMNLPAFQEQESRLQFRAFMLAGVAAAGRDDNLAAHEFLLAATSFDEAGARQWWIRARYASRIDNDADAALAITTIARRWPEMLANDDAEREFIAQVVFDTRRKPALRAEYLGVAAALFAANFHRKYGIEPDGWWQDLALEALEHDDLPRARELTRRIENTGTLLMMRVDRRFARLVRAEPKRFDLKSAMRQNTRALEKRAAEHPRELGYVTELVYAMFDEGRYEEGLRRCDAVLRTVAAAPADKPPYDDLGDSLNWIYNHKASALRALGRWDESLAALEAGSRALERGGDNVSQAINLGAHYNEAGKPQKALDAIGELDWGRGLSPYGRMQLQSVRYEAYLQLEKTSEAEDVLAYLREHHEDAEATWQDAMFMSGDMDGAAEVLIAQLRDPEQRGPTLADVQIYPPHPRLPRMQEIHDRWEKLYARPDVSAVINEVGIRAKQPVHRTGN